MAFFGGTFLPVICLIGAIGINLFGHVPTVASFPKLPPCSESGQGSPCDPSLDPLDLLSIVRRSANDSAVAVEQSIIPNVTTTESTTTEATTEAFDTTAPPLEIDTTTKDTDSGTNVSERTGIELRVAASESTENESASIEVIEFRITTSEPTTSQSTAAEVTEPEIIMAETTRPQKTEGKVTKSAAQVALDIATNGSGAAAPIGPTTRITMVPGNEDAPDALTTSSGVTEPQNGESVMAFQPSPFEQGSESNWSSGHVFTGSEFTNRDSGEDSGERGGRSSDAGTSDIDGRTRASGVSKADGQIQGIRASGGDGGSSAQEVSDNDGSVSPGLVENAPSSEEKTDGQTGLFKGGSEGSEGEEGGSGAEPEHNRTIQGFGTTRGYRTNLSIKPSSPDDSTSSPPPTMADVHDRQERSTHLTHESMVPSLPTVTFKANNLSACMKRIETIPHMLLNHYVHGPYNIVSEKKRAHLGINDKTVILAQAITISIQNETLMDPDVDLVGVDMLINLIVSCTAENFDEMRDLEPFYDFSGGRYIHEWSLYSFLPSADLLIQPDSMGSKQDTTIAPSGAASSGAAPSSLTPEKILGLMLGSGAIMALMVALLSKAKKRCKKIQTANVKDIAALKAQITQNKKKLGVPNKDQLGQGLQTLKSTATRTFAPMTGKAKAGASGEPKDTSCSINMEKQDDSVTPLSDGDLHIGITVKRSPAPNKSTESDATDPFEPPCTPPKQKSEVVTIEATKNDEEEEKPEKPKKKSKKWNKSKESVDKLDKLDEEPQESYKRAPDIGEEIEEPHDPFDEMPDIVEEKKKEKPLPPPRKPIPTPREKPDSSEDFEITAV